jgi:hypothetical protein
LAIADLVATRNVHHADGCKRLSKSIDLYKHVIELLHSVGVKITYNALIKTVSRASVEKNITEIRLTNTSESSVVSSLSPHGQPDNSLTSENTAKKPHTTINHTKLLNSNLVLEVGPKEAPRQKRSKTRKTNLNASIPLFWNTPSNTMPLNLLKERWNLGT